MQDNRVLARPAFVRPLVPSTAKAPPKGAGWVHEVKWDGYRALITKDGDRVRIFTRSGAECTERLPRMVEWFKHLPARSAVLDGELCYIGADGQAKFYALMREMRTKMPDEAALMFFAFDLSRERRRSSRTAIVGTPARPRAAVPQGTPAVHENDRAISGR